MDIEYIKRFVAVSQCLNFSKAADKLFISQPTLSYSIANLEKKLGTPLLVRNTQSVHLTPAGELFLPAAERMVELYQTAVSEIAQEHQLDRSVLNIGYTGPTIDNMLSSWIKTFRDFCPDVKVQILRCNSSKITGAFENLDVDLGILYKGTADTIPGLKYQEVGCERFKILIHSGHPLANQSTINLASLKDEPFLVCERASAPSYYDLVHAICERRGFKPKISQTVELVSDIYGLISAGLGVAILSHSETRSYDAYHIKFVDIEGGGDDLLNSVVLAWQDKLSPPARQFKEIVQRDASC